MSLGLILPVSTACEAGLFAVEDAGGAGVVEALVAGDLDDGALGGEVALHDDEAAGGLERVRPRADDGLAGGFDGEGGFFGEGPAGDCRLGRMQKAFFHKPTGEDAGAAGGLVVAGDVLAAGGEVADEGGALGDAVEVEDVERDGELAGDGDEVQDGVGGAARRADGGDGVFERLAGEDLARGEAGAGEVHDHAAGGAAGFVLVRVHRGDAGEEHGRDAEELAGHGHGVGGELPAAGSGAGAGDGLDGFELRVGDAAGGVGADGLEDVLDGDVDEVGAGGFGGGFAVRADAQVAGRDAAAVEHEAGDVEAGEGHDGAGHVLVAAGDADDAVEEVAAGDEFDGVGDDFARDQAWPSCPGCPW